MFLVTDVRTRVSLPLLLFLGATLVLLLGCGTASNSQNADGPSASRPPETVAVADSEPKSETVEVGYEVGLRAPEFGMSLLDGSRVTSSALVEEGAPVFLYFHATYWPTCRAELRSIKEQVGTDYQDRVAFYVVGTSPSESIEELEEDRKAKGLPWPVAYPDAGMLKALNISSQASKIAIGRDGTITHRYGAGRGNYDSWAEMFDDISAN